MFCQCSIGMSLGWYLFVIIIFMASLLIVFFLIPDDKRDGNSPLEIANKRLIDGDITQGQFDAIKDKLL